jgi:nucleoside phosphorylase
MFIEKVGIISSTPKELEVFKGIIKGNEWDGKKVFFDVGGVGKSTAAAITERMIKEHDPDIIIYVGTVGALSNEFEVGDLVVVTHVIDSEIDVRGYNPQLKRGQFPFDFQRLFKTDEYLADIAFKSPLSFTIRKGFCATQSVFLDSERMNKFKKEVLPELEEYIDGKIERPNIVDMEAAGFLTAIALQNKYIPNIIIRNVADDGKGNTAEDYEKFQNEGIKNYLSLVAYIITQLGKKNKINN